MPPFRGHISYYLVHIFDTHKNCLKQFFSINYYRSLLIVTFKITGMYKEFNVTQMYVETQILL